LFISFIINNSLWIGWYRQVINENEPVNTLNQVTIATHNFHGNNKIQVLAFLKKTWCVTLHVLVHYFLLANYFWMFCEGLYLHTLLVYAFTRAEETLLKMFIAFAWAGPSIPITLYTVFRARDPDLQEHSEWVLHI
jgi:calcitonin receptor-like